MEKKKEIPITRKRKPSVDRLTKPPNDKMVQAGGGRRPRGLVTK